MSRGARRAVGRPIPALPAALLAHAPWGALAPLLTRRLGLDSSDSAQGKTE
jgi:hypothetical protein